MSKEYSNIEIQKSTQFSTSGTYLFYPILSNNISCNSYIDETYRGMRECLSCAISHNIAMRKGGKE